MHTHTHTRKQTHIHTWGGQNDSLCIKTCNATYACVCVCVVVCVCVSACKEACSCSHQKTKRKDAKERVFVCTRASILCTDTHTNQTFSFSRVQTQGRQVEMRVHKGRADAHSFWRERGRDGVREMEGERNLRGMRAGVFFF